MWGCIMTGLFASWLDYLFRRADEELQDEEI